MDQSRYDHDTATFSPQGRVYQVEYAFEAARRGALALGLRSVNAVVLAGLRQRESKLAAPSEKVFVVDDGIAVVPSGLAADSHLVTQWMRQEAIDHRFIYGRSIRPQAMLHTAAQRLQEYTHHMGYRPVGLVQLVAGVGTDGPLLCELGPDAIVRTYRANAIGQRSPTARSYLLQHLGAFADATAEQLVEHAVRAMAHAEPENAAVETTSVYVVRADGTGAFAGPGVLTAIFAQIEAEREDSDGADGSGGRAGPGGDSAGGAGRNGP